MANKKLLSGRVKLTPAANVASDRYNYLGLEQAEPNLGVANGEGFVLVYDSTALGKRSWQSPSNLNNSHANSAYVHANAAFAAANTVTGGSAIDNTARTLANTADQRAVTSGVYANAAFAAANSKVSSSGGTISGDVVISGNLNVQGTTVTYNVSSYVVNDPIVLFANNNISNVVDIGFAAHYVENSTTKHTGLVKDVSENKYYLFDNYEPHIQEEHTLNIANPTLAVANLVANLITNSVLVRGLDPLTQANTADQRAVTSGVYANSAYIHANAAFAFANTVSGGSAIDNTARTLANTADQKATSAGSYANGAFVAANTADQKAITSGSYANSAFTTANTADQKAVSAGVYANAAFTSANTADQKAVTSGSYANSAYAQANSNFTSAVTRLSITNSGASAYLIDQYSGNNPTIYVSAGQTIAFLLNNVVGHPFMIRVSSGGSNYDTGLTHVSTTGTVLTGSSAQGQTTGTLYWKVPFDLVGSTYVYQCSAHGGMVGNIVIQQPASFVASNTVLALSQSNAAFLAANTADQKAVSAGSYANGAFAAANTADQKAVSAGSYANSAYLSQNTTGLYANSAYLHANAAFAAANAGGGGSSIDTYARNHANAAFAVANTGGGAGTDAYARTHANSSYIHANAAFAAANSGGGGGGGGSQTLFAVSLDSFTSNGQNTQFILSSTPADTKSLFVYVDGVYQLSNAYTLSANTITLSEALDANSVLEVRVFGNTTPSILNNEVDVFIGTGACTTFTLSTTPTDKNLTTVIVGGVQQLKSSYNIANSQIIFSEAPASNSDIEVSTYSGGGTHATSFKSIVDTFNGNNTATTFTLTTIPSSIKETFAFLNGVYQQKDTYSISGANIIFTGTATSNDTIEVVTVAGSEMNVTSSRYNTRAYTANGVQTTFTISSGHTANSILVFENGVCQEPITDYTVSGTTLTFLGGAPAVNTRIQIRELPV